MPELLVNLSTLLGADDHPAVMDGVGAIPAWLARSAARSMPLRRFLSDPFTGELVALDGHRYPPGYLHGASRPPDDDPGMGPDDAGGPPGRPPQTTPGGSSGQPVDPSTGSQPCEPVDPGDCPVWQAGSGPRFPGAALARHVRRHWSTCTLPGCSRPAAECDLDHTVPWPDGPTCGCDVAPLCERDHLLKHGTPRTGGPAAAWAAGSGTVPWPWQVHRCTGGHVHWTTPLGHQRTIHPSAPLGPPAGALADPPTPTPPLRHPTRAWVSDRPVDQPHPDRAPGTARSPPATPTTPRRQ